MNLRTTLILIALLGAVGGVLYFLGPEKAEKPEAIITHLFEGLDRNEIEWVELHLKSSQVIVIRPQGVNFHKIEMAGPNGVLEDRADSSRVRQLFELLQVAPAELVIEDPSTEDLELFGLVRPHSAIRFETKRGITEIEFGNDEADGSTCLARIRGDKAIYRTGRNFKNALEFNARDFRYQFIFSISNMAVDALEFTPSPNDPNREIISLEKSALGWRLVHPLEARADDAKSAGFVNEFSRLKISQFLDSNPTPEKLERLGLHDPLRVTLASGSYIETVEFGTFQEDDSIFAMRVGSSQIVSVDLRGSRVFENKPDDFRPKRIIRPMGEVATRVEVQHRGHVRYDVAKVGVSDRWELMAPFRAPAEAKGKKESVEWILNRLERLEAMSFHSMEDLVELGIDLESPMGQARIHWKEGNIVLSIMLTFYSGDDRLFVARDDEENIYCEVSSEFEELLYLHPLALKGRKILDVEEDWTDDLVEASFLGLDGVTLHIARNEAHFWEVPEDSSKRSRKLQALIANLHHRHSLRNLPPPSELLPEPLKKWEEGEPRARLELINKDGHKFVFELFQQTDDGSFLRVPFEFLYPQGSMLPGGAMVEIDAKFADDFLDASKG